MADANKTDGFFAVDRRTWARVCGLGLNRAVAYLVLARGTGKEQPRNSMVGNGNRELHRHFTG
jgi:hypothetical protein